MHSMTSLSKFRNEINNIDMKIVQLLSQRKQLIVQVAQSKINNNQEIRDVEREKKMLQNLLSLAKKYNLSTEYVMQIFQSIIEESVLTQQALLQNFYNSHQLEKSHFSFLGPNGSYSHIAVCKYAERYFQQYSIKQYSTFQDVLSAVTTKKTDYAILPIENSSSGAIDETLQILQKTNLFIVGEINIYINHCLIGTSKSTLKTIKKIYSHPQPLKQCKKFLNQFSQWEVKYSNSTTDAMQTIAYLNKITNAAIGSKMGSDIHKLKVLAENIANQENNTTRFILLARNIIQVSTKIPAKTTIAFPTKNTTEDILTISSILQEKNLIMKYIIYKSNQKNKENIIYIDIPLNISSSLMKNILTKIQDINNSVQVLGCYPSEKITPVTP